MYACLLRVTLAVALLLAMFPAAPATQAAPAVRICEALEVEYEIVTGRLTTGAAGVLRVSTDTEGQLTLKGGDPEATCVLSAGLPVKHLTVLVAGLVIDDLTGPGLLIESAGGVTVAGPVQVSGAFRIRAPEIRVQSRITASDLRLLAAGPLTIEPGVWVQATGSGQGGAIELAGTTVWHQGTVSVDGEAAGTIRLSADKLALTGVLSANSVSGPGGAIDIIVAERLIATSGSRLSASGASGGQIAVTAGFLFTSGELSADGSAAAGGAITLLGDEIRVVAATFSAEGETGGAIRIGSGQTSREVEVTPASRLNAAGRSGAGGLVDVSASERVFSDGHVTVGEGGHLVIDPAELVVDEALGEFPWFPLVKPAPQAGLDRFGATVVPLSNGNVVVTAPNSDFPMADAGAAYLYNGLTGALISMLTGGSGGDQVGLFGVTTLTNGNYLVDSYRWNGPGGVIRAGAVTWGNGTTGINGVVSVSNSLVGGSANDQVGYLGVTALPNGHYLVQSTGWNQPGGATLAGAVTWGNGTTGITGVVSVTNSLVGSSTNDLIGGHVTPLANGHYLVPSPSWNGPNGATGAGAVTWGNGSTGITGVVSVTNSLVGSAAGDQVGIDGVMALATGNYLILSPNWNGPDGAMDVGAVTWGSGTTGITGVVSVTNSLVGSSALDFVGDSVTPLVNGHYLVQSPFWTAPGGVTDAGAVTWGNGSTGISGLVSVSNSLVGSSPFDKVGFDVTPLANGHYLVQSPFWSGPGGATFTGAVTWGNGTTGITGAVSVTNSLIGSSPNDRVGLSATELANGHFLIVSPTWNGPGGTTQLGAVTWGNGTTGIQGTVSATNSLVGSSADDFVGIGGVTALANGHYLVLSPGWDEPGGATDVGAVTWGNGTTGITSVVSVTNSLVGSSETDEVGLGGVTALASGNYVVNTPLWTGPGGAILAGAVTWGSGTTGITGVVSVSNSLVGGTTGDRVGVDGVTALATGNYLVRSQFWTGPGGAILAGAVTWGSGTTGISGTVSVDNSLVGSTAGDLIGRGGVTALATGHYLVASPNWNRPVGESLAGAVTWGNGTMGVRGVVTRSNSILGLASSTSLQPAVVDPINGTFFARFLEEGSGRVAVGVPDPNQLRYSRGAASRIAIVPGHLTTALNQGTAVTLEASRDITISSPITVSYPLGAGGPLTLTAGRSVILQAAIRTDDGNLTVIANARLTAGVVDAQRLPGPGDLTLAPGATIDAGSGTVTLDLRDGAGKTNATPGILTTGPITASAIILRSAGGLVFQGPLVASHGVSVEVPAGITLTTPLVVSGGSLTLGSPLHLNGQSLAAPGGLIVGPGGVLAGTGSIAGPVTLAGGTLSPGSSPGTIGITGALTIGSGSTSRFELNGTDSVLRDELVVTGTVGVGGTLSVTLGFSPAVGTELVLISNDGTDPVTGSFSGLPEGSLLTTAGTKLFLSYRGGDGNDVSLRVVAAPLVVTSAAGGVTASGALLHGTVQGHGLPTSVRFDWGTVSGSFPFSLTATPGTATGTAVISVSATLTGLSPNTTYVYRVVAENGAGTTFGGEQTFTTERVRIYLPIGTNQATGR